MESLQYIRMSHRTRRWVWFGLVLAVLLGLTVWIVTRIRPIVTKLATARISNAVGRIVVASVEDAVESGKLEYGDLVTFEKDDYGRVTALKSNMARANRLQSEIAADVLQRLDEIATYEMKIPLGTLSGSALLAGRGPKLTVRLQSAGSATATFHNEFSTAGINQTKHQILLDVDVGVSILLAGYTTSATVSNRIAVAETVIVGDVPQSYTHFQTLPQELEQYAEDYVMNKG